MLQAFLADVRYGFRLFLKNPGFVSVVIVTLALGIGATTAVFSVVNGVLLHRLPYTHADRTVVLWNHYGAAGLTHAAVAPGEYFDFKEQFRAFDEVAAIRSQRSTITAEGVDAEAISGYTVTPNIFDLLGTSPLLGRGFSLEDGSPSSEPVAILSHAFWARRFGSDPAVIGSRVNIGGRLRTVIGVMRAEVRFHDAPLGFLRERADIWLPSSLEESRSESRGNQYLAALARISEQSSPTEAAADLKTVEGRFKAAFPRRYTPPIVPEWSILAVPLRDQMIGSVRPALLIISAAAGLVLFVACINVVNLLLARGAIRQREIVVRLALGAGRSRLLRQMLTESAILGLTGGLLGVFLASLAISALVRLDPGNIPLLDATRIDATVLRFSVAMTLMASVLTGIFPTLQQSDLDLRGTIGGFRGSREGKGRRIRTVLVTSQIAIAVVVLIGAVLLARSFVALQRVHTGFSPDGVMAAQLNVPRLKHDTSEKLSGFVGELQTRIAALPGVVKAGAVYPLPMSGQGWSGTYHVEGEAQGQQLPHGEYAVSLPGYFETMRIPILAGRDFMSSDRTQAPRVVIVDEMLARKHWPNESAIGKRIVANGGPNDWALVVGVVGHVHNGGPHQAGEPQLYLPYFQAPQGPINFVARTDGNPSPVAGGLRTAVRDLDRDQPITRLVALNDLVSNAVAPQRFNTLMFGIFAIAALVLASIGLYGLISCVVSQRTHEIGIRMALGGQTRHLRGMVMKDTLMISATGAVIGCVAALGLSRTMAGLLFGIEPTDWRTYAVTVVFLLVVAILATYAPARRATRIDPIAALRMD